MKSKKIMVYSLSAILAVLIFSSSAAPVFAFYQEIQAPQASQGESLPLVANSLDEASSQPQPTENIPEEEGSSLPQPETEFTVAFVYPAIVLSNGEEHPFSGKEIERKTVEQGASATPPQGFALPEGYMFEGWNTQDYENVQQNLRVEALLAFNPVDSTPLPAEGIPFAPQDETPLVSFVLKNVKSNADIPPSEYANWDFYDAPYFTLEVSIKPSPDIDPAKHKVVLTAPEGFDFILPTGNITGIAQATLLNGNTQLELLLDPLYTTSASSSISFTLPLKAKGIPAATANNYTAFVTYYKDLYKQNGRPSFTLTGEYFYDGGLKDTTAVTFTPKAFSGYADDKAFNRFGIQNSGIGTSPFTSNSALYRGVFIGRSGTFYLNNYSSTMSDSSNSRLVLRQQPNVINTATPASSTIYEPVWDISAKLYLPAGITVGSNYSALLQSDGIGTYLDLNQSDANIQQDYYTGGTTNLNDAGMVFTLTKGIQFMFAPGYSFEDFKGQTIPAGNVVITYKTVESGGQIATKTQTITSDESTIGKISFTGAPATLVDKLDYNMYAGYAVPGFTITTQPQADTNRYISFYSGIDREQYQQYNHQNGTLTFDNDGGYFINGITYPNGTINSTNPLNSNSLNAMKVEYYTNQDPSTPQPAIVNSGSSAVTVTFPAQSKDNYVKRIVFTFEEGHTEYLSAAASTFTFDMNGFSGLTPNKPGDLDYYHSSLEVTLKAVDGCGTHGETAVSGISAEAHRRTIPVRVSLKEQDTLTITTSGGWRSLYGTATNPSVQIYASLGYDSRNTSGTYEDNVTAKVPYKNVSINFGVPGETGTPQQEGISTSTLLLSRIRGTVTTNAGLLYTNGKFVYTTNTVPAERTTNVQSNGTPETSLTVGVQKSYNLNLNPGEYLTSLVFKADVLRVGTQAKGSPSGVAVDAGTPDALSGKTPIKNVTYWSTGTYHFSFQTSYDRLFPITTVTYPNGLPVQQGTLYNFYAQMQYEKSDSTTGTRMSNQYPHNNNANSGSSGNCFGLYSQVNPARLSYTSSAALVYQGNSFNITLSRAYTFAGTEVDPDIWLELRDEFVYLSNDKGLAVTEKVVGGKTYLRIANPGRFINSTAQAIKITLLPITSTDNPVNPITKAWVDYTKTMAEADTLKGLIPYIIPSGSWDASAPRLTTADAGLPQYFSTFLTLGTVKISKSISTGVVSSSKAGGVLGSVGNNALSYIRPSNANQLALSVTASANSDGGAAARNSFTITYNIPNQGGTTTPGGNLIEYPLYVNGVPRKVIGANSYQVFYSDGVTSKAANLWDAAEYPSISEMKIVVTDLYDDSIVLDIPLRAGMEAQNWENGKISTVEGSFVQNSNQPVATTPAQWITEDINQNQISGTIFQDRTYSSDLSGSNTKYTDKAFTVNLYKVGNSIPYRTMTTLTGTGGGVYSFTGLPDGTYVVEVELPEEMKYSATAGGYGYSPLTIDTTTGNNMLQTGRTAPIVLGDFANVQGINAGIIYRGVLEVKLQEDNSGGAILLTRYLPVDFNTPITLLDSNGINAVIPLPPNTTPKPGQGDIVYTPNTWGTTSGTRTIYVQWSGTMRNVTFVYKNTLGNPVAITDATKIASLQIRDGYPLDYTFTPATPVDTAHTQYKEFKINGGPSVTGNRVQMAAVTSDVEITLVYRVYQPVSVTFHAQGGKFAGDASTKVLDDTYEEDTVNVTDIPAVTPPTGYTFTRWYNSASEGSQVNFPLILDANDVDLYARWTINKYAINIYRNYSAGDDTILDTINNVDYGTSISAPSTPTAPAGHTFYRWTTDRAGETPLASGTTMPDNALNLYAQWTVNKYTITIYQNHNAGDGTILDTINNVNYGTPFTAPAAPTARTGYTFDKWTIDRAGLTNWTTGGTMPDNALNLYAQWTVHKYAITIYQNYNAGDGTILDTINNVDYGSLITAPSAPTAPTGYTFAGWFSAKSGGTKLNVGDTMADNALNLYAQWTLNTHALTFYQNHTLSDTETIPGGGTVAFGGAVTLPATPPTRTGYTFDKWTTDRAGAAPWTTGGTMPDNALNFYAQWTVKSYTLTFYRNESAADSTIVTGGGITAYGTIISLPPAPAAPTGYTFAGWFTAKSGGTKLNIGDTMPAANLGFYAQWTLNAHTLTFYQNHTPSDTVAIPGGGTVAFGGAVNLPAINPTRAGYTFDKWTTDQGGLTTWTTGGTMPNANLNLYAQWKASSSSSKPTSSGSTNASQASSSPANVSSAGSSSNGSNPANSRSTSSSSTSASSANASSTSSQSTSASSANASSTSSQSTGSSSASASGSSSASDSVNSSPLPITSGGNSSNQQKQEEVLQRLMVSDIPVLIFSNTHLPLFGGGETFVWSLLSLAFMLIGIIIAIFTLASLRRNRGREQKPKQKRFKAISLGLGVLAVLLFFVLYDIRGVAILADAKTIVFGLLLAAEIELVKFAGHTEKERSK